eukprot:Gb_05140 [translate_table: standard]
MFSLMNPLFTERNSIPLAGLSGELYWPRKKFKLLKENRVFLPVSRLQLRSLTMATAGIEHETSTVILTSATSGPINAMFSLRALRKFALSVQALFLWIVLAFQHPPVWFLASENTKEGKKEVSYLKSVRKIPSPRKKGFREDEDVSTRRALATKRRVSDGSDWKYFFIVNSRGETLFTQSWTSVAQNVKAIVILLHGLNEHSGRYIHFARRLNSHGYKVYGMDWVGHGGSDGLHGYVPSLDQVVADTKAFLEKVKLENSGVPCFLFGHSTGGAIILKAAFDPDVEGMVEGIILTSPALRVRPAHPIFGAIAPIFSLILPKYQFSAADRKGVAVSRDPEALVAKYSDPLVYTRPIRIRTGSEILRISSYLRRNMKKVTVPFLVLHGTADTVTDPDASRDLYNQAASEHKAIKLYEGFLHDLLFEPEQDDVARDIIDWMDNKLEH